jgi:chromosome segregation ATPase
MADIDPINIINGYVERLSTVTHEATIQKAARVQLEQENDGLRTQLAQAQTHLDNAHEDHQRAETLVHELTDEIRFVRHRFKEVTAQLDGANSTLAMLRREQEIAKDRELQVLERAGMD